MASSTQNPQPLKLENMTFDGFPGKLIKYFKGKEVHFNESPRYITFKYHGFDQSLYDRYGHPTLYNIMRLTTQVLCVGMFGDFKTHPSSCFNLIQLLVPTNCTMFAVAVDFEIDRVMYEDDFKIELDAKVSLGNVGNTSITMVMELFMPGPQGSIGSSKPILKHVQKIVIADIETRKPVPLAEWFKTPLGGKGVMDGEDFRVNKLKRPQKTFLKISEITWSNTDTNDHLNYAGYVQKAVDALHAYFFYQKKMAATGESTSRKPRSKMNLLCGRSGGSDDSCRCLSSWDGDLTVLKTITEKDVACGVKSARVCYMSECLEGDLVHAHLWQEEGDGRTVRCSLETDCDKVVCQLTLEYFEPHGELM